VNAVDEILRIEDLHVRFHSREGEVKAVNGVSLSLKRDSVLAVVGESGSGKSVTALAILGMVPYPGEIIRGEIFLDQKDLRSMSTSQLREVLGKDIGVVFQDPQASLNPTIRIGVQVEEVLLAHTRVSKREAREWAEELLTSMAIPDARRIMDQYSFQLSGGMCQRVMMAMALALEPKILIADEPTSNLDTTLQASILSQLEQLKKEHGTAILLITHDMGVVARMADTVAVMYAGSVVEYGEVGDIFRHPSHPYTSAILHAVPRLDDPERSLEMLRGRPPDPMDLPEECPYLPRCPRATNICRISPRPALRPIQEEHTVACFNALPYDRE